MRCKLILIFFVSYLVYFLLDVNIVLSGDSIVLPNCEPRLVVTGTVRYVELEGRCWVFEGDDGKNYEPIEGPEWMYEDGLRGILFAEPRLDWVSKCMVGVPVLVCRFIPEDEACGSNEDCMSLDSFCKKPLGSCDAPGICVEKPQDCPKYFDPVCGCDGETYSNECEAAINGVSIAHKGPCDTLTCPGDFNHDGQVDEEDLKIFAEFYGKSDLEDPPTECDFRKDGDVDGQDLAIFAHVYGRPCKLHAIDN